MSLPDFPFLLGRPLLALLLMGALGAATWLIARRSWAEGSPLRRRLSLACRCLLLGLLALSLADLQWKREREDVAVAFAVDSSDSVRGSRERVLEALRDASRQAQPGDRLAVVQFGRDALVERSLSDDLADLALASLPEPDGSDLGGALRLARGLLPADGRRRIVLMTDGAATGEDPSGILRSLRDDGIDVVLVPLGAREGPEVLVDEVSVPERVHEGEPYEVRVVVRASEASTGTLTVTRDGRLIGQSEVDVAAGTPTAFRFVDRAEESGSRVYRAHFDAERDGFEQNDAAEGIVRVEGQPTVLLIDPEPARLAPFIALLQAAGVQARAASPEHLPRSVAEASRDAAIVLSNLDSVNLTMRQMEALRSYVREAGGGLMMTGGPDSFGPGGWYETPVEEVLPVDMDVRNEKYFPSLSLVLAIDKSGSMAGADGASKMDLAKEAARQTAGLLQHSDRLGVIAFDSAAKVVVDPMEEHDPKRAEYLIGTIRAGGGTDIYTALVIAEEKLAEIRTVLKHVIVLSDGQSPPRDFAALIRRMRAAGITTSTIAVGTDSDLATMQELARLGEGRFYATDDPGSIPRIFTKEAFTTARSFVVEEPFMPQVATSHAILRGALPLPQSLGYVATSAKPAAEVALVTPRGDPLLALRSFGLGRSAALTTDLGQRWSADWLTSPRSRTLLAQLLRWLSGRSESPLLEATLERRDGRVRVSVEARDESGAFLNFATLRAGVVGPDQARQEVAMRQVAPGRYEAEVEDRGPGAWFAGVVQVAGDRALRGTTTARVFPYSDEYRTLQPSGDALERLALASGARIETEAARLFDRTGAPALALRPAWRELVMLAAILLLFDVALRRVMLPEGWQAKTVAFLRALLPGRGRAPGAEIASAHLSRLREVKADARAQAEGAALGSPQPEAGAAGRSLPEAGTPRVEPAPARTPAPPPPQASSPPEATSPQQRGPLSSEAAAIPDAPDPESAGGYSSRLLAAKRRAKSEK